MTGYRLEIINTDKRQRVAKINGNSFDDVIKKLAEEFAPGPKGVFGSGEVWREFEPGPNSILRKKRKH